MVEVGVKPFAYCDEREWRARYAEVQRSLSTPKDTLAFWLVAGPLFADLNDGHAGVSANDLYNHERDLGLRAVPLLVDIRPDGTFIRVQTDNDFPAETRVERIEGIYGRALARAVANLTGGQRSSLRYLFGSATLTPYTYLYATLRDRAGFGVDGVRPDGSIVHKWLPAKTRAEVRASSKTQNQAPEANYTFSRLANGTIGYIDYRHCEDRPAFNAFLKDTFSSIKSQSIKGLIVDIRANSGGESSLNNDLWSYVTDKPFAQYGGSYIKVSDRLKKEYGQVKYVRIYGSDAWNAKGGSVIGGRDLELVHPGPNELRYSGPVYLLIGPGTFSSALSCAVAARDYSLATIVGEETAEPVNSTGEVYSGQAPRTGLGFSFTTKYFIGPRPRPDGQGVLPDVRIIATAGDASHGHDPVLDYGIRALTTR